MNEGESSSDSVVKLDALGPIIINSDGTLSRIPNWSEMTENEKASATRLISRRNLSRKKLLSETPRNEGIVDNEGAQGFVQVGTDDDPSSAAAESILAIEDVHPRH